MPDESAQPLDQNQQQQTPPTTTPPVADVPAATPPPPPPSSDIPADQPPVAPPSTPTPPPPPAPPTPTDEGIIPPIITPPTPTRSRARVIGAVLALLILVLGIPVGVFLVRQTQDIRERAAFEQFPPEGGGPTGDSVLACNPGDYQSSCTGGCGGCAADAGEAIVEQCNSNGQWESAGSECQTGCAGPCGGDGGGGGCGGGQCSQDGSCQNLETYRECGDCPSGYSRQVTRGAGGDGSCQYDIGSCDAVDSACGTPAGQCSSGQCSQDGSCQNLETYNECGNCPSGFSRSVTRGVDGNGSCTYDVGPCTQRDPACGEPAGSCQYNRDYTAGLLGSKPNPDPNCGGNGGVYCNDTNINLCCYADGRCYEGQQGGCTDNGNGSITINRSAEIIEFHCSGQNSDSGSCSENPSSRGTQPAGTYSVGGCGGSQVDAVGLCGSYRFESCPDGGPPPTAQCLNIKAYDANWRQLSAGELANLKVGDSVRFAVGGQTSQGTFNRARFTVNGTAQPETTTKNPSEEFYVVYTIPAGITTFTIEAQIHHAELDRWL